MAGKAYTMNEMKSIVEYITDHKAYQELKGKKMWMDFANSQLTNRTWQSLKETFQNRILPDIHNPSYKLTKEQIMSFRQGCVIEASQTQIPEKHAVEDSNSNAQQFLDENQETNGENNTDRTIDKEVISGEISNSEVMVRDRASVDTVILENCNDANAGNQPIPTPSMDEEGNKSPSVSLRDLITYSEPLTPMLQEVLHDIDTDDNSDDGEPKLQIVENNLGMQKQTHQKNSTPILSESREICPGKSEIVNNPKKATIPDNSVGLEKESDNSVQPKIKTLRLRKKQKTGDKYVILTEPNVVKKDVTNSLTNGTHKEAIHTSGEDNKSKSKISNDSTQMTDTLLPNNPEALNNLPLKRNDSRTSDSQINIVRSTSNNVIRNRASSHDAPGSKSGIKKKGDKTLLKQVSTSDTDIQKKIVKKRPIKKLKSDRNIKLPVKVTSNAAPENTLHNNSDEVFDKNTQPSQINPCLQSVSLYAEQFNLKRYNDDTSLSSDNNVNENVAPNKKNENEKVSDSELNNDQEEKEEIRQKVATKQTVEKSNVLNSDSDLNSNIVCLTKSPTKNVDPKVRNTAGALVVGSMLGYSTGATNKKRKRSNHRSFRKHGSSETSELTSDSDDSSPSTSRIRRKSASKYMNLRSGHVMLPDGTLFARFGRNIYPIVKAQGTNENYISYSAKTFERSEQESEQENFWKNKYLEEKQKVEKLKTLVTTMKQKYVVDSEAVPKVQSETGQTQTNLPLPPTEQPQTTAPPQGLNITFVCNETMASFKGHWSEIKPIVTNMVDSFFMKKPFLADYPTILEQNKPQNSNIDTSVNDNAKPVIQEEDMKNETTTEAQQNLTSESGHGPRTRDANTSPLRSDMLATQQPVLNNQLPKAPSAIESPKQQTKSKSTSSAEESKVAVSPRNRRASLRQSNVTKASVASETQKRSPKKINPRVISKRKIVPKGRKSKESLKKLIRSVQSEDANDDDVRYMFPPNRTLSKNMQTTKISKQKERKQYPIPKIFLSRSLSIDTESSPGYIDSDVSLSYLRPRRKRNSSFSSALPRNKHSRVKRKSYPMMHTDLSSEPNSSLSQLVTSKIDNSIKSEAYKTDSYQFLMPHYKKAFHVLENISLEESLFTDDSIISNRSNLDTVMPQINSSKLTNDTSLTLSRDNSDFVESSSISLPLSPELSLVENLSLSREQIQNTYNVPTLNAIEAYDITGIDNACVISQIGDSIEEIYGFHLHDTINSDYSSYIGNSNSTSNSVPLLNSDTAVAKPLSDSFENRLGNLLLETATKLTAQNVKLSDAREHKQDKICSIPEEDIVVEEECLKICSYGPSMQCVSDENYANILAINDSILKSSKNLDPNIGRKQKDALGKKKKNRIFEKISESVDWAVQKIKPNKIKIHTKSVAEAEESEINVDSESTAFNDSLDLMHNHTETCLQVDYMDGSVMFKEYTTPTTSSPIIFLNSNSTKSSHADSLEQDLVKNCKCPLEMCSNGAQDYIDAEDIIMNDGKPETPREFVYQSPQSNQLSITSLMTEDLSEESSPQQPCTTNMHLNKDDDTNNSCSQNASRSFSFSILKQLFSITCTGPNVSTISGMEKDYENSSKPIEDLNCATLNDFLL